MKINLLISSVITCALFGVVCTPPTNPNKPSNVAVASENVTSIPDSLPLMSQYQCTVTVNMPVFLDSFSVIQSQNSKDTTIFRGVPDSSGKVIFPISFKSEGSNLIKVILFEQDNYSDTVKKEFSIYSTAPLVSFEQTRYTVFIKDSTSIKLNISDRDSNLSDYVLQLGNNAPSQKSLLFAQRASALIEIPFSSTEILGFTDTMIVCKGWGIDAQSQQSAIATCSIIVKDTVLPRITLVSPATDSFLVTVLPQSVKLLVRDNWAVDSVKYGVMHLGSPTKDTVQFQIMKLDSGVTKDSIIAWDRSGNRSVKKITLNYTGVKIYPPKILPITVAPIYEHARFDTIRLDNYVTITEPTPKYGKDSLKWTIVVDTADSGITMTHDPVKRIVVVNVPSGEILRDRKAVLNFKVTDPKGHSDEQRNVVFWILEKNDPPVITLKDKKAPLKTGDTLLIDTCGFDSDMISKLSWTITRGKYFKPDSLYAQVCIERPTSPFIINPLPVCRTTFTRRVVIKLDTTVLTYSAAPGTLTDSLKFTLSDSLSSVSKYIKFTFLKPLAKVGLTK